MQKYTHPIAPTVKLKSLEVGKVYFRKGSTNTEALGIETISINDWLKSLPENITTNDSGEEISDLVKRTTNKQENLSSILADVLKVSKKYKLDSLTRFATLELQGFKQSDFDENPDSFKYRNQTFYCSYKELETVIVVDTATRQQIKNNLIKDSAFRKVIYPSGDTITNLEILLNKYKTDPKHFVNINTTTSKILFPEETGTPYDIYLYAFEDTFVNLYQSIRQKIIDNLVSAT